MDARRIWIATGTLGVLGVGLGATMAAAEVRADVDAPVVVDLGDPATTEPGVSPSPTDLDPSSSTTTVSTDTAVSAQTADTAPSPVSAQSTVSAQTSPSAPTP